MLIVAFGCAYLAAAYPPLLAAAVLGHLQILRQLLPTLRMDGYYIMADLIGVPNLFGLVRPILHGSHDDCENRSHSCCGGTSGGLLMRPDPGKPCDPGPRCEHLILGFGARGPG